MPILVVFWSLWALAVAIVYLTEEARGRRRWRDVAIGQAPAVVAELGPYRPAGLVPVMLRRAPLAVRAIALSCLALGAMAVPGALVALPGLFYGGGIGLISIPGLIAAAKLFRAGQALLRRAPDARARVANAVAWELWLNGIFGALSVAAIAAIAVETAPANAQSATQLLHTTGFCSFFLLYGAISVAQALALRAVARRHADALEVHR